MKTLRLLWTSSSARVWIILACTVVVSSCFRGTPTENSSIHLILNMDDQEKFEPFEKNTFFKNESAMRMPVPGTVARDDSLTEVSEEHSHHLTNPLKLSSSVMERGQQRYNIYCSPCHGAVGDGKGIVALRGATLGFVPPTDFHSDAMIKTTDGHIFHVITNGIRNMKPYAYQVSENDRWAIIHYIRALQRSQNASIKDVPVSMRDKVQP